MTRRPFVLLMSRRGASLALLAVLAPLALFVAACDSDPATSADTTPVAPPTTAPTSDVVSAHTHGVVSRDAFVRVQFVDPVVGEEVVGLAAAGFSIRPAVAGDATWTDRHELTFQPAAPLPSGQAFVATLELGKLNPSWAGRTAEFAFAVQPQAVSLHPVGLTSAAEQSTWAGSLQTADSADAAAIESSLTATQDDTVRAVTWTHEPGGRVHSFVVADLARGPQPSQLVLAVDGAPLGVDRRFEESIEIPGEAFALTSVRAVPTGERLIELRFSDPLNANQRLTGLITVQGRRDVRLEVDGSIVRLYSRSPWGPQHTVVVGAVKDAAGRKLADSRHEVSFEPIKPEVRFAGRGVIAPSTQELTVPIEVVNVHAVTVEAQRVFASNIPQFLQINDFDGGDQLHRVARTVWRKRVEIDHADADRNRWRHLGLDLGPLLAEHPDGLYRLTLRFTPDDIDWACAQDRAAVDRPDAPLNGDWEDSLNGDNSYWDFWDTASGEGMSWWEMERNRHDPCHPGYYREYWDHDITATRNVLVSDLGLIAKAGDDGKLLVIATDLTTAAPVDGASLELLDYQLQPLATATTDARGHATLASSTRPFAVQATHGDDRAWLKLDRGGSLAVAHFDVDGVAVQQGLKGLLYGERGVWRPGDDVFLTLLVFDEADRIPDDHPVHFTLKDPRGRVVERRTVPRGLDGFYDLRTATRDDAPTGNWEAVAEVGGATFRKTLRVETVMPNRLKIDLPVPELVSGPDPRLSTTLTSRWLHGAIAPNLEAAVEVTMRGRRTAFTGFADHVFDDLTASVEGEPIELFRGRLDDDGIASVDAVLPLPESSPGLLTARLRTRVFEPGGSASVDEVSMVVSPHERYVGIKTPKGDAARGMLLTDTRHPIELVAVDPEGQPAGGGTLDVTLYKISWRWWWEQGAETFADYAGTTDHTAIARGEVALTDGRGTWEMEVKYPEWGRYLLVAKDRDGTHQATKILYLDWPGWAGRGQKDNPGGASVLSVTAADAEVEVGQTATINIPTPAGGRALVSLENGSEVLRTEWVTPTGDTTPYSFEATAAMAPGVYAHVTLLQPHGNNGNDRPLRLVGVAPIEVVDPTTKLEPTIASADVFEPEATAKVTIGEAAGRPMTYTLAVVDEGLLGLTRHKTPNPWDGFYAREALGVRSWDLYDQVVGGYGGAVEGLLAIGGDGSEAEPPVAKAERFPPMVRALGPFRLAAGATKTHEIDIPAYLGEVRVMVVAGHDSAFGSADKQVAVKKPLMALATLPRVLSVGEAVHLPISVFATDESISAATVTVTASGALRLTGDSTVNVAFTRPGDQVVALGIAAGDTPGVGRVDVVVSGHGHEVTQSIELDVRYPALPITDVTGGYADAGGTWETTLTSVVAGSDTTTLELSRIPPLDLERRLDELVRYPHGCVEQTTSAAFPQLALSDLVELSPEQETRVRDNVRAAIDRVSSHQTRSGGFSYWTGIPRPHDWATSYVGHFLLEAQRAGHRVRPDVVEAWVGYQRDAANRWVHHGEATQLEQAYRLYGLALAGKAEIGAMNRLGEIGLGPSARWRLAAAYGLAGQPEAGGKLVASAKQISSRDRELAGTFGSATRDAAMILESRLLLGLDPTELVDRLSGTLTSAQWLSTQEGSWALLALARYARTATGPWSVDYVVGEVKAAAKAQRPVIQVPIAAGSAPRLAVSNPGSQRVWARVIRRGLPPLDVQPASSSGLNIAVSWSNDHAGTVDPTTLAQGTDFVATVVVKNPSRRALNELALTQVLPAGWESVAEGPGPGEGYDYRDVRDDRVDTYFDLGAGESKTFTVRLHAAYVGRFYRPAVVVEAMYDSEINARTDAGWVDVVAAGGGT